MTKVLRILNRFNVGGPTYNAAYLTKYLSKEYETKLIGGIKEDAEASSEYILKNLDIQYEIIPEIRRGINLIKDFKAFCKVVKIIRTEKPQIVHTHASKAGMIGRTAAFYCGVPYVYHTFHGHVFHSYFGKCKTRFFITIEQFLAKKTTKIIAISEKQKYELGTVYKICNPDKIEVVPLGFDLNKYSENTEEKRAAFRSQYSIADDEIVIGIVGRLAPIKNHTLFIDAIDFCIKQLPHKKIRAFIIGDGELNEQLQNYCISKNISISTLSNQTVNASVTFTSWIQDVDVAYAGLDVVALTSLNEGTPVSIIEAQAAGKPIVATNVGGIDDIVSEGITALLSDLSFDDFSQKLKKLIDDDTLRNTMSENSKKLGTERFSYQRLCRDIETLYNTTNRG